MGTLVIVCLFVGAAFTVALSVIRHYQQRELEILAWITLEIMAVVAVLLIAAVQTEYVGLLYLLVVAMIATGVFVFWKYQRREYKIATFADHIAKGVPVDYLKQGSEFPHDRWICTWHEECTGFQKS